MQNRYISATGGPRTQTLVMGPKRCFIWSIQFSFQRTRSISVGHTASGHESSTGSALLCSFIKLLTYINNIMSNVAHRSNRGYVNVCTNFFLVE